MLIDIAHRRRWGARLPFVVGAGLLAAVALVATVPRVGAAEVLTIDVRDFAFQPQVVTIQVGDTVRWTNGDTVEHTATSNAGAPAAFDVYLTAGGAGSVTFDVPGTYGYYCIPHPHMTGTIIVQAAAPAPSHGSGGQVPDVAMSTGSDTSPASGLGLILLLLAAATMSRPLTRRGRR